MQDKTGREGAFFMNIRCVVTGRTPSGTSVIARDSHVPPVTVASLPGFEFHRMWGADSAPQLPSDGTPPPHPRYFPPSGGFRFLFFTVPPNTDKLSEYADLAAGLRELQENLPGLAEVVDPMNPAINTTTTMDFAAVLSRKVYF